MILAFQLVFALVAGVFALRWGRAITAGGGVLAEPFGEAFRRELFARPRRARELALGAESSWVGRLAGSALEALDAERDVGLEMAAEYKHIRENAYQTLRLLRQLARGSVFFGLLCAMGAVVWARFAPQGLDALLAGVAEARGEASAVLAVAIGFALATVLLALRRRLRGVVADTLGACDKFRERLENQVQARLDEGWTLQAAE